MNIEWTELIYLNLWPLLSSRLSQMQQSETLHMQGCSRRGQLHDIPQKNNMNATGQKSLCSEERRFLPLNRKKKLRIKSSEVINQQAAELCGGV